MHRLLLLLRQSKFMSPLTPFVLFLYHVKFVLLLILINCSIRSVVFDVDVDNIYYFVAFDVFRHLLLVYLLCTAVSDNDSSQMERQPI
mmetsp:Transcript_62171/g.70384  ORF Transcript_62171/g.70384 Transcript_62171/m.70384 type:complete len:88 (+) Transcript_62171:98-361(+)